MLLVIAWVLAGMFALVTVIQLVALLDTVRPSAGAAFLVLGYGAVSVLLAWLIPTYLARVGLTLVEIQAASSKASPGTSATHAATDEDPPATRES